MANSMDLNQVQPDLNQFVITKEIPWIINATIPDTSYKHIDPYLNQLCLHTTTNTDNATHDTITNIDNTVADTITNIDNATHDTITNIDNATHDNNNKY